jgi:Fic family protein
MYSGMLKIESIKITPEILVLIAEIDEFKGAWRAFATIEPERLNTLRRVAIIESVGSSTRIEGSTLTDREVGKLLSNPETKNFTNRDEEEVAGYADVIETIFQYYSDIPITENYIKQLHRDLLNFSSKDEHHRGEYKKIRNDIVTLNAQNDLIGIVFETASPFDTPHRMSELLSWFKREKELNRIHPLLLIAVFIVVFLEIHPFQDGNGRLSRILTLLLLLQSGYVYVPYSSLESVIEKSKEDYYLSLRSTQMTIRSNAPNWQPWLMFFLRSLQEQKRQLEAKVTREKNAIAQLSGLALQIMDYVRAHGRVTSQDMVREYGANTNTLKVTFSSLVKKGLLVRHGGGRSTWYGLP